MVNLIRHPNPDWVLPGVVCRLQQSLQSSANSRKQGVHILNPMLIALFVFYKGFLIFFLLFQLMNSDQNTALGTLHRQFCNRLTPSHVQ